MTDQAVRVAQCQELAECDKDAEFGDSDGGGSDGEQHIGGRS